MWRTGEEAAAASVRWGCLSLGYQSNVSALFPGKINLMHAAILAGGESRRMGRDKAALEVGGVPLLERTARLAGEAGLPVLVVGRLCPDGWPLPDTEFVPDDLPGRGPLGGLHAALRRAGGPVLALACDLPLLSADALRWLAGEWREQEERDRQEGRDGQGGGDGLAVRNGEGWEPLFSVYAPACLPKIEPRLAAGRLSLHGLIETGEFGRVAAPAWVAAQLVNANTPEEWGKVVRR